MKLQQIREKIAKLDLLDARIAEITSKDLSGELFIRLGYMPGKACYSLSFTGCAKINLQNRHENNEFFSLKEYFFSQIPCFIHEIQLSSVKHKGSEYFQFVLNLHPLEVSVVCKELIVKNRAGELLFSARNDSTITCVDLAALDARSKLS